MSLDNFKIGLKSSDLVFKTSESLNAWFVDLTVGTLVEVAEWILLPAVISGLNTGIPAAFNAATASVLASFGGVIPLGVKDLGIDLSYASAPFITKEHMQIFLNMSAIDVKTGNKITPVTAPTIKIDSKSTNSLQFGLADESINSILEILQQTGGLDLAITSAEMPTVLNTTALETTIGGFVKTYGDNVPVDMKISQISTPNVVFSEGEFKLVANFDLSFFVKGEEALTIRTKDTEFGIDLDLEDFKLNTKVQ